MKLLLFFTAFISFFSSPAQAQQAETVTDPVRWRATIEEIKPENKDSPFIHWTDETLLVENNAFLNYVDIRGKFAGKIKKARLNSKDLVVQDDNSFEIYFGFPTEQKTFNISALDESGKVHQLQYRLVPYDQSNSTNYFQSNPRFWRFSVGTGATIMSYRQQRVTPFNETAITFKGSANYRLVPNKVDVGFSGFYNAFILKSESPKGFVMKYLGLNARAGYNLIGAPSSLRININAGIYYNSSFSTIGFGNMYGPQLYPEFIYVFNNGNSLLLYGKFSPAISSGGSISFSDNREVAAGMHYSFPINAKNRVSVGVDASQLKISVAPDWGCTNTYSLSGGISF